MFFDTSYKKNNPSLLAQLREANKYLPWINEAAKKYSLHPCIIAGLGSRESHWGLALTPNGPGGTGDFARRNPRPPHRVRILPPDEQGFGRGLMQIDYDWHEFARTGKWMDSRENILYGCRVVAGNRAAFLDYGKLFRERGFLRVLLASYNSGVGGVMKAFAEGLDVDTNTSGHDYSANVLDRAGWFQLQGWL